MSRPVKRATPRGARPGTRPNTQQSSAAALREVDLNETVRIASLSAGGRAVGRTESGLVVFVPRAVPGDLVHIRRARVEKAHAVALEIEILEESSERVAPVCADQARCGGCDWMTSSLERQRAHKLTLVRDALERVGGLSRAEAEQRTSLVGEEGLGYRSRVRLHVHGGRLGFFAAGSHELVEVERCHVCSDELWQSVLELRRVLRGRLDAPAIEEIEVRRLAPDGPAALSWTSKPGRGFDAETLHELSKHFSVGAASDPPETLQLTPRAYALLEPGGFVQVNQGINRRLLREVLDVARAIDAKNALDVFCGVGNFALPLAGEGVTTLGLEVLERPLVLARRAAKQQGLPARFEAGPAARSLGRLVLAGKQFDLVVVDPPRQGAKALADVWSRLTRHRLIMISCDQVTLARDLAELRSRGFRLLRTLALDMFPQTHHVETLSELVPPAAVELNEPPLAPRG